MTYRLVIVLGLAALTTIGCQSGSTSQPKPMAIEGITWQLAEVSGKPAEPVPADAQVAYFRLDPAEKRVTGYSGINSMSGSYELSGRSLKFGPMIMTKRAGPEPLMKQEAAFTEALTRTRSWRAAAGGIELLDATGASLARFTGK